MGFQSRRFAILSCAVTMLAIGLECASAEKCDYKTCGALMARDGLVFWGSQDDAIIRLTRSRHVLSSMPAYVVPKTTRPDKQWPHPRGRAQNAIEIELKRFSNSLETVEPVDKQAKGTQPVLKGAVHETFGNGIPNADRSDGKPPPCFAVAEILVPVDCAPSGTTYTR